MDAKHRSDIWKTATVIGMGMIFLFSLISITPNNVKGAQVSVITNWDFEADLSNWTEVITGGDLITGWDSGGATNGCLKQNVSGKNTVGEGYSYQNFTNTCDNVVNATLTFKWAKSWTSIVPTRHQMYIDIVDPDNVVNTVWSETNAVQTKSWSSNISVDVTTYFAQAGEYSIRLRCVLKNGNDVNAMTNVFWDDVQITIEGSNPPAIAVKSPDGGEIWSGIKTITWSGSDINSDTVTYNIYLSTDGGSSWTSSLYSVSYVESSTPATHSWTNFNTALYSDSNNCYINITANDGNNTVYDLSNSSFTIDNTAPSKPTNIAATPSGWTNINSFSVDWTNPSDMSGIAGAYYKLYDPPASDTDGTWTTDKPITGITVTGDGTHFVYVWLKDNTGNVNYVNRNTTTLYYDATKPLTPNLLSPANKTTTSDSTPDFDWSDVIDATSGLSHYTIQAATDIGFTSIAYTENITVSNATPVIGLADGKYYWRVRAIDNASNIGEWGSVWNFEIATIVPTITSFVINDNAIYTNSTSVILTISAENASWMCFKNEGGSWSNWESYGTSKTWDLNSDDGIKKVYAKVKSSTGVESATANDTIILDATSPYSLSISINSDEVYANIVSVTLTLFASDTTSGLDKICFSNDSVSWSDWENYGTTKIWSLASGADGERKVFFKVKDKAGNTAGPVNDTIILDTGAPISLSITINSNATYTNSTAVTLALNAEDALSGVADMSFSNDSTAWSSWEAFNTTKPWSLPSGDGEKYVYFKVKDEVGNEASPVHDTIILDTSAPGSSVAPLSTYQMTLSFNVSWSGTDAGSGIQFYDVQYKDGAGSWVDWHNQTTSMNATFTGVNGHTYYFRCRAYDNVSNLEEYSDYDTYTTIDTSAPSIIITYPSNNQALNSTVITVTGTASASVGIEKVEVSKDNVNWTLCSGTLSWSGDLTNLLEGNNIIYAKVTDSTSKTSIVTANIVIDTEAPSSSVSELSVYQTSLSFAVSWLGSDLGSEVKYYDVQYKNGDGGWNDWLVQSASTSKMFNGADNHTYYFRCRAQDLAGNWNNYSEYDTYTVVDASPPVNLTVQINNNAVYTNSISLTLTLNASDETSGVYMMQFSRDGITWGDWENFAVSKTYTFPAESLDGTKYVCFRVKDNAGNTAEYVYDTIILDRTPPAELNVIINNNNQYANSETVTLTLYETDNYEIDKMMISNNQDFADASWEDYAASKQWVLTSGDGTKTVYFKLRDKAGNEVLNANAASDTIILDKTKPTLSITINNDAVYTNSTDVMLTIYAEDNGGSGIYKMCFSNDEVVWSAWISYNLSLPYTLPATDGTKKIYVEVKDNAGNIGEANDTINLDTALPTGSVSVNNAAPSTNSMSVMLNLNASDPSGVNQMCFSNNGIEWSEWYSYATTYSWTLSTGNDGVRTVYVRYKDNTGLTSSAFLGTIILDTTPPASLSISINNDAVYTNTISVTLSLSAMDELSTVTRMMISNSADFIGADWENYITSKQWNLLSDDGVKKVYFKVMDSAGNIATPTFDSIILDQAKTVPSITINNNAIYTNNEQVTLTINASASSGISQISFSNDGIVWSGWMPYTESTIYTLSITDGEKTIYIRVKDNAGNIGETASSTILFDLTQPTTTHSLSGELTGEGYKGSVAVTLSSIDVTSGVEYTKYRIDGGEWKTGDTFVISGDGTHAVEYYSVDKAGNAENMEWFEVKTYTPISPVPYLVLGGIIAIIIASSLIGWKIVLPAAKKSMQKSRLRTKWLTETGLKEKKKKKEGE